MKWTKPRYPQMKSWSQSVPERDLVKGGPTFVDCLAGRIAETVFTFFARNVTVEVHYDVTTRTVEILVREDRASSVRPQDRAAVKALAVEALTGAQPAQPGTTAARLTATPQGYIQGWGSFGGRNLLGIEQVPPVPEPMFSPIPVYGFRYWNINDGRLIGALTTWGEEEDSYCRVTILSTDAIGSGNAPGGHDAPHWGCHCGLYVVFDPASDLLDIRWGLLQAKAFGLVELTGTVIEHQGGARGAAGRILHIWADRFEVQSLRESGTYPNVQFHNAAAGDALLLTGLRDTKEMEEEKWLRLDNPSESSK